MRKSFQNLPQINEKLIQKVKKSLKNAKKSHKTSQKRPRSAQDGPKSEKSAKFGPTWPPALWASAQYADPGLYSVRSFPHDQNKTKPSIGAQSYSNTRSHVQHAFGVRNPRGL